MNAEGLRKEHLKRMCEAGKISWEVIARELIDYICEEDIKECLGYAKDGGADISYEAMSEYLNGDKIEIAIAEPTDIDVKCDACHDFDAHFCKCDVEKEMRDLDIKTCNWMHYALEQHLNEFWSKSLDNFIDDNSMKYVEIALKTETAAYTVKIAKQ